MDEDVQQRRSSRVEVRALETGRRQKRNTTERTKQCKKYRRNDNDDIDWAKDSDDRFLANVHESSRRGVVPSALARERFRSSSSSFLLKSAMDL